MFGQRVKQLRVDDPELMFSVNPDWLRNSKGEMLLPAVTPESEPIVSWVKSLSDKEKTWLRVDLEQKYLHSKNGWQKSNIRQQLCF